MPPARNPVDLGWIAVRTHSHSCAVGNFWLGLRRLGQEAVVNVYGVAMAMPQG
jgi:hypothetical protein